ncbi:hypothetical protein E2320_014653, partial [Naja naja]
MQNCSYSKMRNCFVMYRGYIVTAVVAAAASALIVYWLRKPTLNPDDCKRLLAASEHGKRPCLTDWIWHQKKCFYFSDKEESWSASQDFCSFYNASLAIIEKEEMVLGDGGDCAFLNDEGGASSSRCLNLHHWICSKPDEFTRPK